MSDEPHGDRLAEALDRALSDPRALPSGDAELTELLQIARDLRDLPSPAFKVRLAADLARRTTMTTATETTTSRGIRSVTPYLAVRPADELIEFVRRAFGARELLRTTGSGGGLHAEVQIGDTRLMIGGGSAWGGTPTPTGLHLYVPDVDRVYQAALEAGADSLRGPDDKPYGDRDASVKDLAGNHWYIATHLTGNYVLEGLGTVTPYLHPRGAPELIEFLKRAFAAEEVAIHRSPEGAIAHAVIRLGSS